MSVKVLSILFLPDAYCFYFETPVFHCMLLPVPLVALHGVSQDGICICLSDSKTHPFVISLGTLGKL